MKLNQKYLSVCLLVVTLVGGYAKAGGLQISPVTLTLDSSQNAGIIWLSNEGDSLLNAQVRVYHWKQSRYDNRLAPSQGLVISPPMLALAPGEKQLVRVIRTDSVTGSIEDAYRLSIDELPPAEVQKNKLQFLVHYSVPIFIQPAPQTDVSAELRWKVLRINDSNLLEVNNQGNGHAQLSAATFITVNGKRKEISSGLLGYVLPGSTMRWIIPTSANDTYYGGKVEVTINGQKTTKNI